MEALSKASPSDMNNLMSKRDTNGHGAELSLAIKTLGPGNPAKSGEVLT